MTSTILVTGAAGATGSRAANELIDAGVSVRALVRRDGEAAQQLRYRGAHVIVGDMFDPGLLAAAFEGVDRAYFVYPIKAGLMSATVRFATAAAAAGARTVVNMSQISARPEAESTAAREHWLAERVLDGYPFDVTHLMPTFFADNVLYAARGIAAESVYGWLFGSGVHAPIAADDLGRVAAAILLNPDGHAGQRYPLYGPTEYTQDEIAEVIGSVLGRTVTHRLLTAEEVGRLLGVPDPGFTRDHARFTIGEQLSGDAGRWFVLQHLEHVAVDLAAGVFAGTNDLVEKLTGRRPTGLAEFVGDHADAFGTANGR